MQPSPETIEKFSRRSLARNVPDEIIAMADALHSKHPGTVAILAYGSCLRGEKISGTLIDYYVLTENLSGVSTSFMGRLGCALVPPNVYYAEARISGQQLRTKYACLPLSVFCNRMKRHIRNPYFWARFSQPSALVYARDKTVIDDLTVAISQALRTTFANAKALTSDPDPLAIWTAGFTETYKTEFRPEKLDRAAHIVSTNREYYRQAASFLAAEPPIHTNRTARRLTGKLLSMARLTKAAFTFQGGAEYIAWKIERHSGEKIILTDWQKRHPIVSGLMLLPALLRKGAVR